MKLPASKLLPAAYDSYYLTGEDVDALTESAEALLASGDTQAVRLRLDVSELARIEEETRNQGLFGATACYAMVRNAQSASPKQTEYLLKLATSVEQGNRLIICAPEIAWKKALHKKMQALADVAHCEFSLPDTQGFYQWLSAEIQQTELNIDNDALMLVAEQLCGMRLAARQWIERLQWYDGGEAEVLNRDVMLALLGERAPDDLEVWVHAVAMKDKTAVRLALRLLHEQKVNEVQMHSWLSTRFQQLLMYSWHQAKGHRNPLQAAKVFGDARGKISKEAKQWRGTDLSKAISILQHVEKLLKGASIEEKSVVMERLTLQLVGGDG
jgi:DNA polymerase III delta subunit